MKSIFISLFFAVYGIASWANSIDYAECNDMAVFYRQRKDINTIMTDGRFISAFSKYHTHYKVPDKQLIRNTNPVIRSYSETIF